MKTKDITENVSDINLYFITGKKFADAVLKAEGAGISLTLVQLSLLQESVKFYIRAALLLVGEKVSYDDSAYDMYAQLEEYDHLYGFGFSLVESLMCLPLTSLTAQKLDAGDVIYGYNKLLVAAKSVVEYAQVIYVDTIDCVCLRQNIPDLVVFNR